MKSTISQLFAGLIICSVLVMSSCKKDKCVQTMTYTTYVPVYLNYADMRNGVKTGAAQPLKTPGKIYLSGKYIFVNEVNQGIHVIDNTNPSSPQNVAFISIPGNVDLAVSGNNLYADNYIDLLTFNISDINNITLVKRIPSALPYNYGTAGYAVDTTQGVVTSWQPKLVTEKMNTDCSSNRIMPMCGGGAMLYNGNGVTQAQNYTNSAPTTTISGPTNAITTAPGVGGSTARFAVASNTLYIVDNARLHVYDITNSANPQYSNDQTIGWNIETIFPYGSHLFIGSASGFYIYDISNPHNPSQVSVYNHITACDPVVVDNHYAYFTLNSGAPCDQGINELEVVDISNIASPTLVVDVPMTSPKGVGVDGQTLFVCDQGAGLKVYNTANINNLQNSMTAQFSNINSFDVIPYNKDLIMVGSGGLYQYNYSNVQNITLMSTIPVSNK
jgi:hypothetical protein